MTHIDLKDFKIFTSWNQKCFACFILSLRKPLIKQVGKDGFVLEALAGSLKDIVSMSCPATDLLYGIGQVTES